jgi:chromosome segregation ATPase
MRWFRRRSTAAVAKVSTSTALVPRNERALVALAVHAQQLSDRVDRLERRLEETEQEAAVIPTTEDVMAVRLHSAKVAAELTRVSVELRAEIEQVAASVHQSAPHRERVRTLAESILDLSDRLDTLPSDHDHDYDRGRAIG